MAGIHRPTVESFPGWQRKISEEVASRQEKMLVFTQFREMTDPLSAFLAKVFDRPGLVLHGGTPVKKRKQLVDAFQGKESPSRFFILSLKAGGTGLNLTAASHVVHFDRWWNPAVENQATDRGQFRIGQKRNVLVHKFVCQGTIEEKIDELITEKSAIAEEVLEGGSEVLLTEMDNEQLLKILAPGCGSSARELGDETASDSPCSCSQRAGEYGRNLKMSWYAFKPYVSVAQRQRNAAREVAKLAKKGRTISPVKLASNKIAATFWGKAWCENLEAYSDFSNRLPRGRSYVRNGSVVDLQIQAGKITALRKRIRPLHGDDP